MKILLKVGDTIEHKEYGMGKVTKIDEKDVNMRYLIHFEDDSKSWLANWQIIKEVNHGKEESK